MADRTVKEGERVMVRGRAKPGQDYVKLPDVYLDPGESVTVSYPSTEPPPDPEPPPVSGTNILGVDLSKKPKTGAKYDHVKALAAQTAQLDLASNNGPGNDVLIAKGIMGDKAGVLAMLKAAKNLSGSGCSEPMGPGRNLIAWPLAASLAGMHDFDAEFKRLRDLQYPFNNLVDHAKRANNHGCACHAALIALDLQIGDKAHLDAKVMGPFKSRFDVPAPNFSYGSDDFQPDQGPKPVIICPPNTTTHGANADGTLPEEQRREGGGLNCGDYNYAAASQLLLGLIFLRSSGVDGFGWGTKGSERTFAAFKRLGCKPSGDDEYLGYMALGTFGTAYLPVGGSPDGKWIACTDYLFLP